MSDLFNEINKASGKSSNVKIVDSAVISGVNVLTINGNTALQADINCKYLNRVYKRVPIMCSMVGDEYGVYYVPKVGDLVIVLFPHPDNPVIIGYINKTHKALLNQKRVPSLEEGDMLSRNVSNTQILTKLDGSLELTQNTKIPGIPSQFINTAGIRLEADKSIIVFNQADALGAPTAGLKIAVDGSFKMLNATGYGVEVSADGAMTFRGVSINHTQTPGSL